MRACSRSTGRRGGRRCPLPRVPWYARLLVGGVVAYALSPLDLIPDVIPVLGYLDDLVLVPLGIALALKLIPPPVPAERRREAQRVMDAGKPVTWRAAAVIVALRLALAALVAVALYRLVA